MFTEAAPAKAYLATLAPPYVVKTDGLAAGKGVLVTASLAEAEADVDDKLSGAAFGAAGRRVVIEEGLTGPELSLLVVCDGTRAVPLAPAQDFKRIGTVTSGRTRGAWVPTRRCPGWVPTWSTWSWTERSSPRSPRSGPRASTTEASSTRA